MADGDHNGTDPENKAEFRPARAKYQPPDWTDQQVDAFFGVEPAGAAQDQQQQGETENFRTDEDFDEFGRIIHGDQRDQPAAAQDEGQQIPALDAPQLTPASFYDPVQESAALQPQGQQQPLQLEPGSFEPLCASSYYIPSVPSHQQSFNLDESGAPRPHAQLSIAQQGSLSGFSVAESSGAQSQLGLSSSSGSYPYLSVPRLGPLIQTREVNPAEPREPVLRLSDGNAVNHVHIQEDIPAQSIEHAVPAAPHAQEAQQTTEAQGMPQNPQGLEQGLFLGGYRPPDFPTISTSFHKFITRCSKPFVKQLSRGQVSGGDLQIHKSHFNDHIKQLLNDDEVPRNGFAVRVYDILAKEYPMNFKWRGESVGYFLHGKGWKDFCRDKFLVENRDWLIIWAFRHAVSQMLSFVIARRRLEGVTEHIKVGKRKKDDT